MENLKTGYIHLPYNEVIKFTLPENEYEYFIDSYCRKAASDIKYILEVPLDYPVKTVVYIDAHKILYIQTEITDHLF